VITEGEGVGIWHYYTRGPPKKKYEEHRQDMLSAICCANHCVLLQNRIEGV
jgi:hypothetical protein